MKELTLFKKLLDDDMINFNALLIKNYRKLNINEKDIIVLSYLARQEAKGNRVFNPSRMKSSIALERKDLDVSLASLCDKGYISISLENNPKTSKEQEMFSIDKIYNSIVDIYTAKTLEESSSFFEEIANLYEELFNKQITPSDIDICKEWAIEKMFSIVDIKNEMIEASKIGKTNLKYVDQQLLRKAVQKKESPEYSEANKIIEELKQKWKK